MSTQAKSEKTRTRLAAAKKSQARKQVIVSETHYAVIVVAVKKGDQQRTSEFVNVAAICRNKSIAERSAAKLRRHAISSGKDGYGYKVYIRPVGAGHFIWE